MTYGQVVTVVSPKSKIPQESFSFGLFFYHLLPKGGDSGLNQIFFFWIIHSFGMTWAKFKPILPSCQDWESFQKKKSNPRRREMYLDHFHVIKRQMRLCLLVLLSLQPHHLKLLLWLILILCFLSETKFEERVGGFTEASQPISQLPSHQLPSHHHSYPQENSSHFCKNH